MTGFVLVLRQLTLFRSRYVEERCEKNVKNEWELRGKFGKCYGREIGAEKIWQTVSSSKVDDLTVRRE